MNTTDRRRDSTNPASYILPLVLSRRPGAQERKEQINRHTDKQPEQTDTDNGPRKQQGNRKKCKDPFFLNQNITNALR